MSPGTPVRSPSSRRAPEAVAWVWRDAALGALDALPAGIVATQDPRKGAALAVGVLPAAIFGLAPARRARLLVAVVGALFAVALLAGAVLADVPVVAVAGRVGETILGVAVAYVFGLAIPLLRRRHARRRMEAR